MQIDTKREDILKHSGHLLVMGGPGCGKTTLGLLKAKRELKELPPSSRVLFLSFSRAAVYQIRMCSRRAAISLNHNELKLLVIQTYHSLFWQILQTFGGLLRIPFPIGVLLPEDELVQQSLFDGDWHSRREQIAIQQGELTYDLFPKYATELVNANTNILKLICRRYPYIIVDEFQDTSEDEYAFILTLSKHSTVLFLADSEQRIYDFREGVNPKRIEKMIESVAPKIVDLSGDNFRSAKSDIWDFANGVLAGKFETSNPEHVHIIRYPPRKGNALKAQQEILLKKAYLELRRHLMKDLGIPKPTIAIVSKSNRQTSQLSAWLLNKSGKMSVPIYHEIDVDHRSLMISWRFLVQLVEFGRGNNLNCLVKLLEVVRDLNVCQSRKRTSAQTKHKRITSWITKTKSGNTPKNKYCSELLRIIEVVRQTGLSGNLSLDVRIIFQTLLSDNCEELGNVITLLRTKLPFQQADSVTERIKAEFSATGRYEGLLEKLISSVTYQRMIEYSARTPSCSLMTIHKCKGKEFDGMIIYDHFGKSGRIHGGDKSDGLKESRRLLRVAITRARESVVIITPSSEPSPLLPAES